MTGVLTVRRQRRPMLQWRGYYVLPPLGHFLFQWLGVTRASDAPGPCGHLGFRAV